MVFGARGYAVLLVSASEKFNSTLRGLLPAGEFWPLDCASGAAQARRKLLETSYDLVIINAPLPVFTSSTMQSLPAASFLLIMEEAISGMLSTVAVTSRRA